MAISTLSKKADFEATLTKELNDPDGEPLGIKVTVRSDQSKKVKAVNKKIAAAAVSLRVAQGDKGNDAASEAWIEKQESLQLDRLVAAIASIDWGDEEWEKGKGPLPATDEGTRTFVSEDWIAVQVNDWIAEVTAFINK